MRKVEPINQAIDSSGTLIETHPAFGTIMFSRTHHGGGFDRTHQTRLYGSALEVHPTTMHLRICHSTRYHSCATDRYSDDKRIIDIEISAAQFSELITSINMGPGVPCTIRHIEGVGSIPEIHNDDDTEVDRVADGFRKDMKNLHAKMKDALREIDTIMEKKTLTKDDRNRVRGLYSKTEQFFSDNAAFVVDSHREATEKISVQAKAEVEAFISQRITALGHQALAAGAPLGAMPLMLEEKIDE